MAPMSQLDRMEKTLERMDTKLDKVDRIVAVHGNKIANANKEIGAIKARAWVIIVLVLGAVITGIANAMASK